MELRRRHYTDNNQLKPFIAISSFDPIMQSVNCYDIFLSYANIDKAFIYSFSDTVNTLTLSAGAGITYRYGYTRGGIDYVFDGASFTNPFLAGDTKRYVVVNNASNSILATIPNGALWAVIGSKCTSVNANNSTSLYAVHFIGTINLTTIPFRAFLLCNSLIGDINIPQSVSSVGGEAFTLSLSILGVCNILSKNITFGNNPFPNTRVNLPDQTGDNWIIESNILYNSFKTTLIGTSSIKSGTLTIPSTITNIGASAFYICSSLTGSLTIPSAVTNIGDSAFFNCTGFTELSLPFGYNLSQVNWNWRFNFSNNFTAASLNQSILNIAGGGNTTRTITIGATNKARLLAAYPTAETDANARGITIV